MACGRLDLHAVLLFVQMSLQQRGQVSNVMTFKYARGPAVTILVSKSAGRYRIQSDSFEAIWLIVQVIRQPAFALLHLFIAGHVAECTAKRQIGKQLRYRAAFVLLSMTLAHMFCYAP